MRVSGEGELGFHEWLGVYDCPSRWNEVVGLCWLDAEGVYHDGGLARVMEFDQLMIPERSRFSIGQSHSYSWKRRGGVLILVLFA